MIGYTIIALFVIAIAYLAKREWDWRAKLEVRYGDFLIKNWEKDGLIPDHVKDTLRRYAKEAVKEKAYEIEEILRLSTGKNKPVEIPAL